MVTLVTALLLLIPATNLLACNWGSQGGADYVPQRRGIEQQQQQPQEIVDTATTQSATTTERWAVGWGL